MGGDNFVDVISPNCHQPPGDASQSRNQQGVGKRERWSGRISSSFESYPS
jgi:hypothetical protein